LKKEGGVGNGVRTRDFRSHSPKIPGDFDGPPDPLPDIS